MALKTNTRNSGKSSHMLALLRLRHAFCRFTVDALGIFQQAEGTHPETTEVQSSKLTIFPCCPAEHVPTRPSGQRESEDLGFALPAAQP